MRKYRIFLIALLALIGDQIIKVIVSNNLSLFTHKEIIKDFFYLTYVENTGGAWGIFSNNTIMLTITGFIAVGVIICFIFKEVNMNKLVFISYGLLLGGIIGNIVDRIINNYVIDYLDFNIFGYNFPVFNMADVCIVVGVGILLIDMIRGEYNECHSRKE